MPATSAANALFTKTQQKVLALLFGKPGKSYYTNEIMRLVDMGRGNVSRELERLVSAEILTCTRTGNQKHYQANANSPIFRELKKIIQITCNGSVDIKQAPNFEKDAILIPGINSVSRKALKKIADHYHIRRLDLFGSAARGELKEDSDIDLLVEFEKDKAPSLGGMVKLQDDLSALFGRRMVDVATRSILNNPYRRQAIRKNMVELYAA
ncbi:MAG: nucleotidyltransferase domain-containing protein [Xanthomonadales bacterium]